MVDFTRYRDVRRLQAEELKVVVMGLLAGDDVTRARAAGDLRETADSLLREGVGAPGDPSRDPNGYRQVLALLAGVLLRTAGASAEAVRGEVASRDTGGLESLIRAIYARMEAMPPAAPTQEGLRAAAVPMETAPAPPMRLAPAPSPPQGVPPSTGQPVLPEALQQQIVGVPRTARGGSLQPGQVMVAPVAGGAMAQRGGVAMVPAPVGVAAAGSLGAPSAPRVVIGSDNPALAYLKGLVSDDVSRLVQASAPPAPATSAPNVPPRTPPPGQAPPAGPVAPQVVAASGPRDARRVAAVTTWHRITVREGVEVLVRSDIAPEFASEDRREALLAEIRAQWKSLFGSRRDA